MNGRPLRLFHAARGPDWGIGEDYYPIWHPNRLSPGTARIEASNYGLVGYKQGIRNDPRGTTGQFSSKYRGRVRPVNWDGLWYPTFSPMLPAWNNLPRGALYQLQTAPANKAAVYVASRTPVNVGKPLHYTPAAPARLLAGVN